MIIKNAEFVTSQSRYSKVNNLPEIAVAGRSNVGKSSLINMLARQSKLARTSSEPGRTRLINYFKFTADTAQFMLVDLPGYGFAKGSKTETARWGIMIEEYLNTSQELKHVFVLLDIRHEPTLNDKIMLNYLYKTAMPFTVVATKADKLTKNQLHKAVTTLTAAIGIGRDNLIVTSAQAKQGGDLILNKLEEIFALSDDEIIDTDD